MGFPVYIRGRVFSVDGGVVADSGHNLEHRTPRLDSVVWRSPMRREALQSFSSCVSICLHGV